MASETTERSLKVFTQTMATKVLFHGKQATGVAVNSLGLNYVLSASKEVILSAGTFQSPQLLMLSGIGPAATLQEHGIDVLVDRPGVGQNMWDHVMFGPSYAVNFDTLDRVLHDPVVLADSLVEYVDSQEDLSRPMWWSSSAGRSCPSLTRPTCRLPRARRSTGFRTTGLRSSI